MKKRVSVVASFALSAIMAMALASCSNTAIDQSSSAQKEQLSEGPSAARQDAMEIKPSPDKYTWYVKNYKGMNAASVGYESMAGDRRDAYGDANVRIVFVSSDGTYLDPGNNEQLAEYVVTGQNLAPNTEIKLTYAKDPDGGEYSNLVDVANYNDIVLAVEKPGQSKAIDVNLTPILPSPDKYVRYVKDYVGMNVASAGYISLAGDYRDYYGKGNVKLELVSDDGSYIDPSDIEMMSQYVVTGQSIEPNTEISMTFGTDSEGKEYDSLVATQSVQSITLNVAKPR